MTAATLNHVEYLAADEIGEDTVAWLAGLLGLHDWPEDHEAALLCISVPLPDGDRARQTWLTNDIDWARGLDTTDDVQVSVGILRGKCPAHRVGWPSDWLQLDQA